MYDDINFSTQKKKNIVVTFSMQLKYFFFGLNSENARGVKSTFFKNLVLRLHCKCLALLTLKI